MLVIIRVAVKPGWHIANYGRVTLTLRNLVDCAVTPEASRSVTFSFGDPIREISGACGVSTMFEPE